MRETITRTRNGDGTYHVDGWRDNGTITCVCGALIPMTEEVVEYETNTGRITNWGTSQGVCDGCHILYVDDPWACGIQCFVLGGGQS